MAKLLLLLGICLLAAAKRPGVKMGISHDAIDYWKNNWLPDFIKGFSDIYIANANTTIGNSSFQATVTVHNMSIYDSNVDEVGSSVKFNEQDQVILIEILNLTTKVHLDFIVETGIIAPITGTGYLNLLLGDIRLGIHTDVDDVGRPTFALSEALLKVTDIDLIIEGSVIGDILTWAVGVIRDVALPNVEGALSGAILSSGNSLLEALANNTITVIPINGTNLAVDYTLSTGGIVHNDYLELQSRGLVLNTNLSDPTPPIPDPVELPDFNPKGDQIQLWLTEYTINSALYAAFTDDLISIFIPAEALPFGGEPLNTQALALAIPQLAQKYGDDALVDLGASAQNKAPSITLKPEGSEVVFDGEIAIMVRQELQEVRALVMNTTLNLQTSIYVEDWVLKGRIDGFEVSKIDIVESTIGDINTAALRATLNIAVQLGLGAVNSYLAEGGLPLPQISDSVSFNQTNLIIDTGFLEIDATPKYTPNKTQEVEEILPIVPMFLAMS